MSHVPVPPLIPGSLNLSSLQVSTAKIGSIVGDVLSTLNTWKGAARAATTANITLSGTQTVDGIALVDGDKILVKNQSTASENGLYIVTADAWDRSSDLATGSNAAGVAVFISEGTVNADKIFVCTTNEASAVVGTNNLTFTGITAILAAAGATTQVQYNDSGSFAADAGLTYDGAGALTTSVSLNTVTTVSTNVTFGTTATDLHGFYGTSPIARPAVSTANTTFVANTSGIGDGTATYLGYTVEGIVTNLRALGLLS